MNPAKPWFIPRRPPFPEFGPAIAPAIVIALLLPGWPGWVAAACPAPLPESIYATRCTGGEVTVVEKGAAVVYRDCPKGDRPARPIAREILALIEKVRCMVEGQGIAEGRVGAEGGAVAGAKVIVTSGYRSRAHNLFSWAVLAARGEADNPVSRKSKHMLGKAVDFYVRGYSFAQHQVLLAQLRRWAGHLPRALRGSREVIWARVYKAGEARDPDNRHPYPYIHLELRR